jgi:preprotein translocase subunit SecE
MSVHWSLVLGSVVLGVMVLAAIIYFADSILIYVFKNGLGLW